ncbi:MAG: DUF5683 domain-containing protein [Rhodothermus sp.]|nr:DUF5683 domain-containing protein [Rhodothermus sp.]
MHRAARRYLLICGGMLLSIATKAQPVYTPEQLLQTVWQAYQALEYDRADSLARHALTDYTRFTPDQLVALHTVLALVAMSRNEPTEARRHFEAALSLNPELQLDPVLASPKVRDFFEQIRQEMQRLSPRTTAETTIRYVLRPDPRPEAALRSLLLPGWGQRYKGQHRKGWILTGSWGLLLGGSLTTHLQYKRAYNRYRRETDPTRIETRYRTANRWFKTRNGLLIGLTAVWAYSYLDALLQPVAAEAPIVRPYVVTTTPGLKLQWRF